MRDYSPPDHSYDEAFEAPGRARPHYLPLLEGLAQTDLPQLAASIQRRLGEAGVCFGSAGELLSLDPIPRLLTPPEWETVKAGILQRTRALERFVDDVYGEGAIVDAGVVPQRVVESAAQFEPTVHGAPVRSWISIVGFDLVRCPSGEFRVLEDQIRMPSGIVYALAAREALQGLLPGVTPPPSPRRAAVEALGGALRAAAPAGVREPSIVLLSEGPEAAGWYEHSRIGRELGIPVVVPGDLDRDGEVLCVNRDGHSRRVDVVYQRTDEDRFTGPVGAPTGVGELLLEPCRAGRLACVNAPGSGVGDDKLVHAYVEEMIRFYLAEEPVLRSIESFDLGRSSVREAALAALDELVFKPRAELGGEGVVIWSQASEVERTEVRRAIAESPAELIAQRRVDLSSHPTVCGGVLAPRHVDLRPYVIRTPDREWAFPGGLTRVALEEGSLIVNSARGGGVKDTWIIAG